MIISWIGFFVSIAILLIGARKHLGISLLTAAVVLGLFTLSPTDMLYEIYQTFTDPATLISTAALTMIPVIGGVLQESGQLDHIVQNLRIGKKGFLGSTPALLGLLPIPGGALFSAPLIEKGGKELEGHVKMGINVWFRHILFFIYPLAPALFIPADIAGLNVYKIVLIQIPLFVLTLFLGYFFFLRKAEGEIDYSGSFSLKELMIPLFVILTAPILDFTLSSLFNFPVGNLTTFIAIGTSLAMGIYFSGMYISNRKNMLKDAITDMKPWNFTIMMLGIYTFINMFKATDINTLISDLSLPGIILSIGIGFLLGVATGRINLPASIIIPIYVTTLGLSGLPIIVFALIFFSVFMGYVITPVHPCVGLSIEYFDTNLTDFLKSMLPPVITGLATTILVFFLTV